jgi:hypothetical protein
MFPSESRRKLVPVLGIVLAVIDIDVYGQLSLGERQDRLGKLCGAA